MRVIQLTNQDNKMPIQGSPQKGQPISTAERFQRILQANSMTEDQFQSFMKLPYGKAIQAAYDAVLGKEKYAFLMTNNEKVMGLPEHLMPETPSVDERVKQIYVDRIFEFYLMKYIHKCSDRKFKKYVKISGLDILEKHVKSGKGILLLNSHYGPGHLAQIIMSRLGYPLTTISSRNFYPIIGIENHKITVEQIAGNFGAKIIGVGCSVLNDKRILHMTGEGVSGKSGREYSFFQKKWHIPNGFAYMVEQTGAICVPVLMSINAEGKIHMSFKPRIAPNKTLEDRDDRIDKMVQRYVNLLKQAWREDPANVPPIIIRNYLEM